MEIEATLRSRRSVRRFRNEPVSQALVEHLLQTACQAPSAHNRQPWRFGVVMGLEARRRLAEQMGAAFRTGLEADGAPADEIDQRVEKSRARLEAAPVAVVLCVDLTEMDHYPDETRARKEQLMAEQSAALAGGTLLLAAQAAGLGGVWLCAPLFAQPVVRAALDLPDSWEPQALLLLGYPAEIPPERPRKPLAEVTRFYL